MMRTNSIGRFVAGLVIVALSGRPAAAQLPSASAPALGMGDNFTALARGFSAVAWNPALLGMPDTPGFSLAILPVRANAGLDPVTLADVARYDGQFITDAVKEAWLQRIAARGEEKGSASGGVTYVAMNIGPIGFQLSTVSHLIASLSPDAAELVLFGNAYRSTGEDFDLGDSRFQGVVTTTGAVSVAQPLPLFPGHFSVGATVKYIVGNALVHGQNVGSSVTGTGEVNLAFPIIQSDTFGPSPNVDRGRGFALDLAAAWRGGPLTVGVAMQNVFSSFAWDTTGFYYRPGRVQFDGTTREAEFDVDVYANAPAEVKAAVDGLTYEPQLLIGAAWRVGRRLTVAADVRRYVGDGLEIGPESHAGIGAELRLFPFIPFRAGFAKVAGGTQLGVGTGLEFGGVNLSASYGRRSTELGTDDMAAFGLTFGGGSR
jgi:hypothetical protein